MTLTLSLRPDVTVVAVCVHPDAYCFGIRIRTHELHYYIDDDNQIEPLPPGQYEIVGLRREIPEEQAKNLIKEIHVEIPPHPSNDFGGDWRTAYVDYENPGEFAGWNGDAGYCDTATDALKSAIKANGGDPELNWLIIKKIQ